MLWRKWEVMASQTWPYFTFCWIIFFLFNNFQNGMAVWSRHQFLLDNCNKPIFPQTHKSDFRHPFLQNLKTYLVNYEVLFLPLNYRTSNYFVLNILQIFLHFSIKTFEFQRITQRSANELNLQFCYRVIVGNNDNTKGHDYTYFGFPWFPVVLTKKFSCKFLINWEKPWLKKAVTLNRMGFFKDMLNCRKRITLPTSFLQACMAH